MSTVIDLQTRRSHSSADHETLLTVAHSLTQVARRLRCAGHIDFGFQVYDLVDAIHAEVRRDAPKPGRRPQLHLVQHLNVPTKPCSS